MKKIIRKKGSLTIGNKARQRSFISNPVRGSCGRFPNLPPPEDEGG